MNYLEPNFDPKESKVSELRRILAENNVGYPSKAKKSVLIKLFDTSVKPKVGDLRKRQSVGPSSEGIEKVKTKNGMKVKSPKKRKRSRDARLKEEQEQEDSLKKGEREEFSIDIVDIDGDIKMELSPRKSPTKSKKTTDTSDESSKKKKRRKNQKKSQDGNHSKTDITNSPEKSLIIEKFESNSTSSDSLNTTFNQFAENEEKNIFKSENDSKSTKTSRRTQAPDITKLIVSEEFKSKLEDAMAAQDSQDSESIPVEVKSEEEQSPAEAKSDVEQVPVDIKSEEEEIPVDVKIDNATESVEDVTKDIIATNDNSESKQGKKPKGKKCLKAALKLISKSLYFSAVASAVLLSVWGREQRIQVGFCGNELALKSIAGRFPENHTFQLIDQYLEKTMKPDCLPCPENAVCSSKLQMECVDGFNYAQSPFSLGGLIPIPGKCIPDDSEERAFTKVVDYIMKYLRNKNTAVECGNGENDMASGISEEELYEYVFEDISEEFELSKEKISQLWSVALEKINDFPEVKRFLVNEEAENDAEQENSSKKVGFLRSNSRKGLSLKCLYDHEFKKFYFEYLLIIWGVIGTLFSSFLLKRSWEKNSEKNAEVDTYVKRAADILKKNAQSNEDVPFLHTLQLKEEILSDITDLNKKNQIWDQLIGKLEEDNTNISSSQTEIQGEILKCWTWIGDVDME
ncbi:similar to Saccharomyces cerevisiae YDR458C HEH2 Inner nuclear membrane (INM) protein [Maudiozyma saulgeensis]|uniref:Similar to Saccharomyces cerevisiae YDR458C HEH2 Inner nuclear membrane (INM) protein n=1 Tax=Maudiozyma saulgeensis TaxID=1789683 RepID=A0A1X7R5P5_9SACH|nr:similar to Saccharomyces cerevisiae YDR458C HEH2 Inner nuclear membrane (INM) protein [Kazachstania saulgeensis]